MPPGGEDLITRGEWIPLSSSPVEFLLAARSIVRARRLLLDLFQSCRLTEARTCSFRGNRLTSGGRSSARDFRSETTVVLLPVKLLGVVL